MKHPITAALVGIVGAIPATIGTAFMYLFFVLDAPISLAATDGFRVGTGMIPLGCSFGVAAGLGSWTASRTLSRFKFGSVVAIIGLFGGLFGLRVAHTSPHISATCAAASGFVAWLIVGALIVLVWRAAARAV